MIVMSLSVLLALTSLPGTLLLLFLSIAALLPKRVISLIDGDARQIKLAVVIPAHNEERCIADTLNSLQACDQALDKESIYVIADNCTDRTEEIATKFGVRVMVREDETLRGKGYALNFAFRQLLEQSYDAIIVIDADTTVDKNLLNSFRSLFSNGASAGQARYRVKNVDAGLRPRLMGIAFMAFNNLRPIGRDNARLSAGILGNGFGLSTQLIKRIPYDSFSIVEDLEYHLRLIHAGYKVRFLSNTTVWSDMPVSATDAQSQRERWEGGRLRMLVEHVPRLLKRILKGQFIFIEPLLEILLLPLGFHAILLLAILLIAPVFIKTYALISLMILIAHVVIAMVLGKATRQDWKALASTPFYILWKLTKLGGIIKSSKKEAAWKRTRR